jgi:hypothetical protein
MDNRTALRALCFVVFGIYFVWFWSERQTRMAGISSVVVPQGAWSRKACLVAVWTELGVVLPPMYVIQRGIFNTSGRVAVLTLLSWVRHLGRSRAFSPSKNSSWHDLGLVHAGHLGSTNHKIPPSHKPRKGQT